MKYKSAIFLCSLAFGICSLTASTIPPNYSKPFEGKQDFSGAGGTHDYQQGAGAGGADAATPSGTESGIQSSSLPPLTSASSASSFPGLSGYPQVVQNIVRATDGDAVKIFDLIRNTVEFQPYFGFKKDEESVWFSRRGNDADQTLLLVECLRAAGYTANYRFGYVVFSTSEALAWFGADDFASLEEIAGNAGYDFSSGSGGTQFAVDQIWCEVVIDGVTRSLSPAYKLYDEIAGIDLETAMNYTRAGLLAAGGGTETSEYAQGISETGLNAYLQARAMDLVQELQTNHPTASIDEIISGRRIVRSNLAADFSDSFYSPTAFVAVFSTASPFQTLTWTGASTEPFTASTP